ncbi:FKBP-type peptidyl-prolyl cis-trans isomerase [Marinomonas sp. THO17]|uniref:FKBP-type peptidyl-prolyl cis-trans isomerase n=1 Tax=Marinomonas sp. THO17 TaxID=3149048 RepID=UPI00336BBCF2
MKKTLIATLMMSSVALVYAHDHDVTLETKEQKLGYSMGTMFGSRMAQNLPELDIDTFIEGFKSAYQGEEPKMTMEEITQSIQSFQQEEMEKAQLAQQKAMEESKAASEAWLAEKAIEDGVMKTDSGLMYKIITKGAGDMPSATDTVKVDYEGSLIDGTVFDSSYERGEPITFQLDGVIPGWTEGLQLMPVGSKYELYIPSDLAYGPGGTGPIPPNAALKFVVELHKIVNEESETEAAK